MVMNFNIKKMMIKMNYFFILIILLGVSKCKENKDCPEGSHKYITIKNNSDKIINWRHFIPDTVYVINGSTPASDLIIQPHSFYNYGTREDCWEKIFKDNNTLYLLIFDNDTVQAIGWQAISGTNRGLLKRVKVDLNFLKNNNFTITYP